MTNIETGASNDFDHHRYRHENDALQLFFGVTASASQVPVYTTLAIIDDLGQTFGSRLSLRMSYAHSMESIISNSLMNCTLNFGLNNTFGKVFQWKKMNSSNSE